MGAVNLRMTQRASLILLRLIVKRRHARNGRIDRERMAFQAQRKYRLPRQHSGIGGAVRNVTGFAAIHAHW